MEETVAGFASPRLSVLVADRPAPLTVLLAAAERTVAAEIDEGLRVAGHRDLRAAHAQVFAALSPEGSHLTALAVQAGMTKQAMGELVRYLEHHAYLHVEPDPRDRRAKLIRLTPSGRRAQEACSGLLDLAEHRLADRLGTDGLTDLRRQLRRIAAERRPVRA